MHTSISLNLISTKSHHQRRRLLTVPLIALVFVLAQLSLGGSRTSLITEASPTQSILTSSLVGSNSQTGSGGGGGIAGGGGSAGSGGQESKVFKRSFAGLGCLGVYDKAKFARLDRVCEECYTLYREPDIHSACRQDCFRNSVFTRCVDALLLSHEAKKFDEMVDELYGK